MPVPEIRIQRMNHAAIRADGDYVLYWLINFYNMSGNARLAVREAMNLHERNPDSPEAARLLGRCLIDRDPKKALSYLQQACERNRSAEYLFDLARCQQILGKVNVSRDIHWEILDQNPYASASWTNLFLMNEARERLWPLVSPMLDREIGHEDEYFLVAAVKIAQQQRATLPAGWYRAALERWLVLQAYPGFGDEKQKLRQAMISWQQERPQDIPHGAQVPRGFIDSLVARFIWPRRKWIPAD